LLLFPIIITLNLGLLKNVIIFMEFLKYVNLIDNINYWYQ